MSQFLPETDLEPIRPSALSRVLNCPGSRRLAMKAPPKESSKWADAGTAAHTVIERCMNTGRVPFEFYGETIVVNNVPYVVDNDVVQATSHMVSHLREQLKQTPGSRWFTERTLYVPGINNSGTCDWVNVDYRNQRLFIDDYKHGTGVYVSEHGNDQLRAYAWGALHNLWPKQSNGDVDVSLDAEIHMTVHQPRFENAKPLRTETVTVRQLTDWFNIRLWQGVDRSRLAGAPLKGGDHCRFCPAKPICTVYLTVQKPRFGHVPIKPGAATVPEGFNF